MSQLAGQVAIVTGGGTGIGAATALAFAREGVAVVAAGRRAEPLHAVARQIQAAGAQALAAPADVADEAQANALVEQALAAFGRVDILVNNAGVFHVVEMSAMTTAVWDETLNVNLRGAYLCARAVWPRFVGQKGGQIVNVSSVSGVEPYPGNAAYCASKFGLNGLAQVLALEGRQHNIRVSVLCPGSVDTPIWGAGAPPAVRGRMMRPEDVAEAVVWLATRPAHLDLGQVVIRNQRDPWDSASDPLP